MMQRDGSKAESSKDGGATEEMKSIEEEVSVQLPQEEEKSASPVRWQDLLKKKKGADDAEGTTLNSVKKSKWATLSSAKDNTNELLMRTTLSNVQRKSKFNTEDESPRRYIYQAVIDFSSLS